MELNTVRSVQSCTWYLYTQFITQVIKCYIYLYCYAYGNYVLRDSSQIRLRMCKRGCGGTFHSWVPSVEISNRVKDRQDLKRPREVQSAKSGPALIWNDFRFHDGGKNLQLAATLDQIQIDQSHCYHSYDSMRAYGARRDFISIFIWLFQTELKNETMNKTTWTDHAKHCAAGGPAKEFLPKTSNFPPQLEPKPWTLNPHDGSFHDLFTWGCSTSSQLKPIPEYSFTTYADSHILNGQWYTLFVGYMLQRLNFTGHVPVFQLEKNRHVLDFHTPS